MSYKIRSGYTVVKFKGEYDWGGLYALIMNWLMERKYETHDKRYKEKIAGPAGAEIKSDIYGEKRHTSYTKLWISFRIRGFDYIEKEKIINGKKRMMTGGRIAIRIITEVEFDWQNVFTGSPFRKMMGRFYDWVKKKDNELLIIDVHEYETLRIEHEIKKFLGMETDTHAFVRGN
ncbi:MAG: hypothetical protein H8D38_05510 [DPANN group archaeon]|nr:hypothetical protein [DPANN group archaeon]